MLTMPTVITGVIRTIQTERVLAVCYLTRTKGHIVTDTKIAHALDITVTTF